MRKIKVWDSKNQNWIELELLKEREKEDIKQRISKVMSDACKKQLEILMSKSNKINA